MFVEGRTYIAIDLKSFYASVECMERGRDPMTTHLVVADPSRTEKTICLAVAPALKAYGVPGRSRLFEVVQRVRQINAQRLTAAPGHAFRGASDDARLLKRDPSLALDYIVAPPQMARYLAVSAQIYRIYLKYVAPEDIHVYSIDEVFIDATAYLKTYRLTAREFAVKMMLDVLATTGVTAAAGIGTNLYLCKAALDIGAKHARPDQNGVRIAELDEMTYRQTLWTHRPLTDFWRVGPGYARKLEAHGLMTMGDIARCSLSQEDLLYRLFGVNAELLIDHAWGYEPCTIADIHAYRPASQSIGSGQVLHRPYAFDEARLILREMTDLLSLDLVSKRLVTNQLVLTVGYDVENLTRPEIRARYTGPVTTDGYGRQTPKHAHGTANLERYTASTRLILDAMTSLFDRIVNPLLLVRRLTIAANRVILESDIPRQQAPEQLDLFTDYEARAEQEAQAEAALARERRMQEAMLTIREKFGKNAVLKGMNLQAGATAKDRNNQIGGHKA